MKKYFNSIFSDPVLEKTYIKIGFHNRLSDYYMNAFFQITADVGVVVKEIEDAVSKREGCDIYIAPVSYSIANGAKDNVAYVMALVADFDMFKGEMIKNMPEDEAERCRTEMIATLQTQTPKPTIIVKSGNGLQVYWQLKKPMMVENNVTAIENVQKALANISGKFKGDPAVAVLGHTVRLPGTKNFKDPEDIKECTIVWTDETVAYDLETLVCELNVADVPEQLAENPYTGTLYEAYQTLGTDYERLRGAALECEFPKWMARNPEKQTHSLWFHLINNLAHFGDHGSKLLHIICERYPGYTFEETERLFQTTLEKVKNQGFLPTSCSRIAEDGFECPKTCVQKSPATMLLSQIKAKLTTKCPNDKPVNVETAIMLLNSQENKIENIKIMETFITEIINPLQDSTLVKEEYLNKLLTKLGLTDKGSFTRYKKLIKNTEFGISGNIQVDIAEVIRKTYKLKCIGGDFYIHEKGVWKKYTDRLKTVIIELLGASFSDNNLKGIIIYLQGTENLVVDQINQHVKKNMINLKNGMLEISEDGSTRLLPHDSKYYALNQLNIVYNGKAQCPKFVKFLNACFGDMKEKDRQTTIQALFEWFGYGLLPGNQMHKLAMLIGEPRSGKGILLSIYSALLGQENISNIAISELHKPVNSIELLSHLANVCPEINEYERFNEAFIKSLVGEDGISGRALYQAVISFICGCKLFAAANNLPCYFEKSGAMEMRLMLFPFNIQVPEEKRNINLKKELLEELPGILNLAIKGRISLFKRGRFVESKPMLELKKKTSEQNDLIGQWFSEKKYELDPRHEFETIKYLYSSFRDFCAEEGINKIPLRKTFKKDLERVEGVCVETRTKPNQVCVFFDWEKLGVEVAKLEPVAKKRATSFDLANDFVLLEGTSNSARDQIPQTEIPGQTSITEQAAIDTQVIKLLENKYSDTRAFN